MNQIAQICYGRHWQNYILKLPRINIYDPSHLFEKLIVRFMLRMMRLKCVISFISFLINLISKHNSLLLEKLKGFFKEGFILVKLSFMIIWSASCFKTCYIATLITVFTLLIEAIVSAKRP